MACSKSSSSPNKQTKQSYSKNSKNTFSILSSSTLVEPGEGVGPSKTRSVHEIIGIPPLDLSSIAMEPEVTEGEGWVQQKGKSPSLEIIVEESPPLLQFSTEEVRVELDYWKQSVVCYILGANPPWDIVEGFIYRIWNQYNVDRISFPNNGVFMVRLPDEGTREKILQQGHYLCDNKPLIVKPWSEGIELVKSPVKFVPVWVRLMHLSLKFWGKCIPRIAGLLGEFFRCDKATEERTRLGLVRILLEVPFGGAFPEKVIFLDEEGKVVEIAVIFEWKPVLCYVCGGVGHEALQCRRIKAKPKEPTKVWRPKAVQPSTVQPTVIGTVESTEPPLSKTPEEVNHSLNVVWSKSGAYKVANTPTRPLICLSRQDLIEPRTQLGNYTFLDALNNITPKLGIGTSGSALPPIGVMHSIGFWNVRGINSLSKQKKSLWDQGGRKIAVAGLPPMGCLPVVITMNANKSISNRSCIESLSAVARDYNKLLQNELISLQLDLADNATKIVYIDIYSILDDIIQGNQSPSTYGFEDVSSGCCGTGYLEAAYLCNTASYVCADASKYVFWDSIHPTQMTYYLLFKDVRPVIDFVIKD